ncbi:murein L,D-transpeptidase catalytic domain family protein [Ensifer sp. ENS10]|uniref:murein L,D-transpeptidase catalytic domain-containing protein n=1 Tax=Ensifer sp. ENS10 TaxID=2769286 RepID=UPI0017864E38|nr:murein L,D-transpeptidase catalytic domain family protein [Ensifer sp. ENS10]MBD9507980.1 murein L,D-transpeptidase catalytic domain family protein [Ensifer sp. ENS10]
MAKLAQTTDSNLLQEVLAQLQNTLDAANKIMRELGRDRDGGGLRGVSRSAPPSHDARFLPREGLLETGQDEAVLRQMAVAHDLEVPMDRLIALRNERYAASRPRYWGIVNFDLHSSKPRMFVFDVRSGETSSYLCAHGRGSEGSPDDGIADIFSERRGLQSHFAKNLPLCRNLPGGNGYSLTLDGLEDTNSRARSRSIVIHGADYVSPQFAQRYGRIGRSEGCPALDHSVAKTVIDQLKLGSLLMHWKAP